MLILRGVEGNVGAEHTQYSRGHQLLQVNAKVCRSIDNNVREVGGKVDGADGPQSLLLQLLSGRVTIELGRVLHFKAGAGRRAANTLCCISKSGNCMFF